MNLIFFPCQRRTSPGSNSSSSTTYLVPCTVTLCWTSPGSSCSIEVFAALVELFKAALAFARPSLAALAAKIVAELRCSPGSSSSSSPEINCRSFLIFEQQSLWRNIFSTYLSKNLCQAGY